jgi:hypothetical protein
MARSPHLRLAFFIALLCAVSLRLLTPPGWMPNLDGRGGAPLVICTGDGTQTLPSPGHDRHGPAGKAGHEVCAFSGLALDAAPQPVLFAAPAAAPRAAEAPRLADQTPSAPARRRPQSPRAPPLQA